jgi:hypothetical protein
MRTSNSGMLPLSLLSLTLSLANKRPHSTLYSIGCCSRYSLSSFPCATTAPRTRHKDVRTKRCKSYFHARSDPDARSHKCGHRRILRLVPAMQTHVHDQNELGHDDCNPSSCTPKRLPTCPHPATPTLLLQVCARLARVRLLSCLRCLKSSVCTQTHYHRRHQHQRFSDSSCSPSESETKSPTSCNLKCL